MSNRIVPLSISKVSNKSNKQKRSNVNFVVDNKNKQLRKSQKEIYESSEESSSEEDERKRNKKQTSSNASEDSDEDSYDREIKLKNQQMKKIQEQKNRIVNIAKKKLGEQEVVIETLNSKLEKQNQNLNYLNKENKNLRDKSDQLDKVIQEKKIVQSHFAAQLEKVENVRKSMIKKSSTLISEKADQFNKALSKGKSNGFSTRNSLLNILSEMLYSIENNYFLSSKVHYISNSAGQKCEVFFSQNAYFINIYLISFIIFLPFAIKYLISANYKDFNFLFLHSYDNTFGTFFASTLVVFIFFQLLFAIRKFIEVKQNEIREEAKSGRQIDNFRIIFGKWNWRIREKQFVKKNQFALMKYAKSFFNYVDKNDSSIYLNQDSFIKIMLLKILTLTCLIGSMILTGYLNSKRYLLELFTIPLISELIHGVVIAVIGKVISDLLSLLNKQKDGFNSKSINTTQALPCVVSILMNYSTFLTGNVLSVDFNIFESNVKFDADKFDCREQQTSHFFVGLAVGHFLVNVVWQYFPSLYNQVFAKQSLQSRYLKQISFDMMEASVPLVIQNMIILCFVPFSAFSIILSLIFFGFNFLNGWIISQKIRLPQYHGSSKAHLKAQFSFFYNMSLIFVLCCFSLYFTNIFLPQKQTSSDLNFCNPYHQYEGSIYGQFKDSIRSVTFLKVIYDILTWYPLLLILFLVYLVSNYSSKGLKKYWQLEIQNKKKEVNGVKSYYEQRIKRLEERIQQAQNQLHPIPESLSQTSLKDEKIQNIEEERRKSQDQQYKKQTLNSMNMDFMDLDHLPTTQRQKVASLNNMQASMLSTKMPISTNRNIQEDDSFILRTTNQIKINQSRTNI